MTNRNHTPVSDHVIGVSFDHRFVDRMHALVLSVTVKQRSDNPFEKLDPLPE